jgi:hypothetical protein
MAIGYDIAPLAAFEHVHGVLETPVVVQYGTVLRENALIDEPFFERYLHCLLWCFAHCKLNAPEG